MRGDFKIQFGEPKYKRKQERLHNKKHRRERSAKNHHDKSNRLMVFKIFKIFKSFKTIIKTPFEKYKSLVTNPSSQILGSIGSKCRRIEL